MAPKTIYCFDTSALFDAGIRWYPPDVFPSFWEHLEELLVKGRLKLPFPVAHEATRKTHTVAQWVLKNQKINIDAFVDLDIETQKILKEVSSKYPDWTSRGRNQADPFVVAMAKAKGWMVVTGEHPSTSIPFAQPKKQHKLKIPNVCDEFKVNWMGIPDFIKKENWSF